jgi:Rad3-related DNA helicase
LTTILVVDEAHHLSAEILEEIRLLTNLETSQQKLLQIVLAGQPELDQKLDSHELRQLKQRIALRCHLDALSLNETREYMGRRLKIAGAPAGSADLFREAIEAVFRHSRGIPRLVNTICENALLSGYAKQAADDHPEIIDGVARDLRLGVVAVDSRSGAGVREKDREKEQTDLLLGREEVAGSAWPHAGSETRRAGCNSRTRVSSMSYIFEALQRAENRTVGRKPAQRRRFGRGVVAAGRTGNRAQASPFRIAPAESGVSRGGDVCPCESAFRQCWRQNPDWSV